MFNVLPLKGFLWYLREYYVNVTSSVLLWVIGELSCMTSFTVLLQDDT